MSDRGYDYGEFAQPLVIAAWRGRCSVPIWNVDMYLSAHLSNKARLEVSEVARMMPESLCLEMVPRLDVWPSMFERLAPTECDIDLFFFSGERDEKALDSLLADAIRDDLALKAMTDEAELLIFPSLQLPEMLHSFQGRFYFWGILSGQKRDFCSESGYDVHIQNTGEKQTLALISGNYTSFEGNEIPKCIPSETSPSPKRSIKMGRPVDDAWKHATQLDKFKQKLECKYCGFVSVRGGISRLKAHLAGGNPEMCLPGCQNVSSEVKRVMADWYTRWVENTKAICPKEIQVTNRPFKGGRPVDDAWKHVTQLDKFKQKLKCKYCGIVSVRGGISRLKAHLAGGDPKDCLPGCQNVSPEVKRVMADWYTRRVENTKALCTKEIQELTAPNTPFKRGRPLDDAWEHAIQLDDTRLNSKCKYCDFVFKRGGIARLKAHLSGGDQTLSVKGCPNVLPGVKRSMSKERSKCKRNAKGRKLKTFRVELLEAGTPNDAELTSKRRSFVPETCAAITYTSRQEKCRV